jgi:hypothetical protein
MSSGDQSFWVRSLEDEHVVGTGPGALSAAIETERDGELFIEWLRDRAAGASQHADYYREVPEDTRFVSQFTLLLDGDDPIVRWFRFDDGKKVVWKRHKAGHEAVPTKGKRQLKGAAKIINKVKTRSGPAITAGASAVAKPDIRLKIGGTTKATGGFDEFDNVNVMYGSDLGDWIDNDFNCSVGGVLAIGGISAIFSLEREFRGKQALVTAETELVINDGTECFYQQQGAFASRIMGTEEVYLHELIHTLGVGHACGDDSSPKCGKSDLLGDANMGALVHGDGTHATSIGRDDRMSLEFLYTHDPDAAVPSRKLVPGAKKFCKKLKGCGEGQGNCQKDSQCNGSLTCEKDAGAQFGLPPKTDVCMSI